MTSYSCNRCPLLVSIMAYCPGVPLMAGHSLCASVEGFSFSAHLWNICGFKEFLPQFSPLPTYSERFHLFFSFQIPTTCWWFSNLCLSSDFSSECQPGPYNQFATSHPCPTSVSNHLNFTKNLLFLCQWSSHLPNDRSMGNHHWLFPFSSNPPPSTNQSPCPIILFFQCLKPSHSFPKPKFRLPTSLT